MAGRSLAMMMANDMQWRWSQPEAHARTYPRVVLRVGIHLLQMLLVVRSQSLNNVTADEYSYAAALGAAYVVGDNTTLGGLDVNVSNKWIGVAFAPSTGMLYGAPGTANTVLVINPLTNITDATTLSGFGTGAAKWWGIAFAPTTDMLYCAPYNSDSVLVINPVTNTTDVTTLRGFGMDNAKWFGIAFAPTTGLLYCAPYNSASVLTINPSTNTTDTATLAGFEVDGSKWNGIAFAPTTGMLYCAPNSANSVLIINPLTNTTDNTTLGGLTTNNHKWRGITFAPNTGKLYCAPHNEDSVLIIDPITNTTDTTTLGGLGSGGAKWIDIAFAPTTGMLFCAPFNGASPLVINPLTNTTDNTTLGDFGGTGGSKWLGIAFAPNTGMLYCAPINANSVLMIGFFIEPAVLQPFRLISQLRSTINTQNVIIATIQSDSASQLSTIVAHQSTISAQTTAITALQTSNSAQLSAIAALHSSSETQSTTIVVLQSSDLAQQSTISAQSFAIAVLQSDATSVCSRPLCGDGTTPADGMCVPDCDTLRRRGVDCEPYCDEAPLHSSDHGDSSLTSVVAGVVVGVILALVVGVAVIRHFAIKRNDVSANRETPPHQPHIATMFMNPLHQGPMNAQFNYEEPVALNSDYIEATGAAASIELDDERYVAPALVRSGVGNEYQVFRSGSSSEDQYKRLESAERYQAYARQRDEEETVNTATA